MGQSAAVGTSGALAGQSAAAGTAAAPVGQSGIAGTAGALDSGRTPSSSLRHCQNHAFHFNDS